MPEPSDFEGKRFTYAEYKAIADESEVRYEFIDGRIVKMNGGTLEHARLIARVGSLLDRALDGQPCVVMPSHMRVRIRAAKRATYPDLHVECGGFEMDPEDDHALVNPTVIVEVLSPSTEDFDHANKFAAYRRLPSVREYVLVAQDERRIEVFRREGRRWILDEYERGERFSLHALKIEIAVDEIYVDRAGTIVE